MKKKKKLKKKTIAKKKTAKKKKSSLSKKKKSQKKKKTKQKSTKKIKKKKKKVVKKKAKKKSEVKSKGKKKTTQKIKKSVSTQKAKQSAQVEKKKPLSKEELIESIRIAEDYGNIEEVVLTDAEGNVLCKVRDCDEISTTEGYCRYHYLMYWKMIQRRREILKSGKLQKYIDELTSHLPDKYLKIMRKDLSSEKDFMMTIQNLNIDDVESDEDSLADELQGIVPRTPKESNEY